MTRKQKLLFGMFIGLQSLAQIFAQETAVIFPPVTRLSEVQPPADFEEGLETRLSEDQIEVVGSFKETFSFRLQELHQEAGRLLGKPGALKEYLIREFTTISERLPKRTELISVYTLRRALKVVQLIEKNLTHQKKMPGMLFQQNRILLQSLQMAKKYYQYDLEFIQFSLEDSQKTEDTAEKLLHLPFGEFALDYAEMLMNLNESIIHTPSNYDIGLLALGLFHWDLFRDAKRNEYGPVINKIDEFLKREDALLKRQGTAENDRNEKIEEIFRIYLAAISFVKQVSPHLNNPSALKEKPSRLQVLQDHLKNENFNVRLNALHFIGEISGSEATSIIISMIADLNLEVQNQAETLLINRSFNEKHIEQLILLLNDAKFWQTRKGVVKCLKKTSSSKALEALIDRFIIEENSEVAETMKDAIQAIQQRRYEDSINGGRRSESL